MSRFFKSAAFPILIVVVLAFFAQKLISGQGKGADLNYGGLVTAIESGQVKALAFDQKDNSVTYTLTNAAAQVAGGARARPAIRTASRAS